MAWSEAARKAAAEARKRKHGSATHVQVTSVRGAKSKVSRGAYASNLRKARLRMRETRSWDKESYDKARIQREHKSTRHDAGIYAASEKRRAKKTQRGQRRRLGRLGQSYLPD